MKGRAERCALFVFPPAATAGARVFRQGCIQASRDGIRTGERALADDSAACRVLSGPGGLCPDPAGPGPCGNGAAGLDRGRTGGLDGQLVDDPGSSPDSYGAAALCGLAAFGRDECERYGQRLLLADPVPDSGRRVHCPRHRTDRAAPPPCAGDPASGRNRRRPDAPAIGLHDRSGHLVDADLQYFDHADHDADGPGGAGRRWRARRRSGRAVRRIADGHCIRCKHWRDRHHRGIANQCDCRRDPGKHDRREDRLCPMDDLWRPGGPAGYSRCSLGPGPGPEGGQPPLRHRARPRRD